MNVIATDCETYMRLLVEGRVDTNTSPQLQQAILNAVDQNGNGEIDISSAGLRALLIGQKTAASKGGSMKLTNVSDVVMNIFEMSGFSKILKIE